MGGGVIYVPRLGLLYIIRRTLRASASRHWLVNNRQVITYCGGLFIMEVMR